MRLCFLTVAALLTLAATLASAQCGPLGCPVPADVPRYEWRLVGDAPDQAALYLAGRQLGNWSHPGRYYRPIEGDAWGEPQEPPFPPPPCPEQYRPATVNYGLDLTRIGEHGGYWLNGRLVKKEEAYRAVEKGLPDDRAKLRLTVIGTAEDRQKYLDALKASPEGQELLPNVLVWSVPADHWSLKDNVTGQYLFVATGKPTVYLTDAVGKVLHRQDDYRGPQDFQAIRKAGGYDPKKDRDLRNPLGFDWGSVPLGVWLLAGFVALAFLLKG